MILLNLINFKINRLTYFNFRLIVSNGPGNYVENRLLLTEKLINLSTGLNRTM